MGFPWLYLAPLALLEMIFCFISFLIFPFPFPMPLLTYLELPGGEERDQRRGSGRGGNEGGK